MDETMNNRIEVSIVIPVYNVERYIGKTIESVQNQDFVNYEIILVDDGSKDYSGEICDQYASNDSRIKVIHQPNGGVMSARFAGVDASKGQYIAFLDGDDRMPPTAISNLYKKIVEEQADIVKGSCVDIDENGKIISQIELPGRKRTIETNKEYREWLIKHLGGMNLRMFKKSILKQEPRILIDRKIKNNEDLLFKILSASRINRAAFTDELVYQIVPHNDSASHGNYGADYWRFVMEWFADVYKKYDVFFKDYMYYKLSIIYGLLLREGLCDDFNNSTFDDVRITKYDRYYGLFFNLALFFVKHPNKLMLFFFRFHPKRFFKTFF